MNDNILYHALSPRAPRPEPPLNDPEKRDRRMKGLDVFLERDRDRELFDLPNKALTG